MNCIPSFIFDQRCRESNNKENINTHIERELIEGEEEEEEVGHDRDSLEEQNPGV